MSSIFDLKTNVEELSSTNMGMSRMQYEENPPTRDITGNNFANGAIHFRFQTSGCKWWLPSRSYVRTRFRLTKGDGVTPVDLVDGVAPNMGQMSNLFQSSEMRINDKVVSRIADFMPQVDALQTRLNKSRSWLDSIGVSNWWETNQTTRLAEVTRDGSIIKGQAPVLPLEVTNIDTTIGYTVGNTVAYVAITGIITFAQGAAANPPPNTNISFRTGDFIVLTTLPNNEAGALNVRLEVLTVNANFTMRVRAAIQVDVPAAVVRFSRIRINAPVTPASRQVGQFETVWIPPLSLFNVKHAMPGGRYELVLNPQTATSFQKRAIESLLGVASKTPTLPGGAAADYQISVVSMYFYCCTVEGPRADDITYLLDLDQIRAQSEKIDNTSFGQKNFDVSPSTYALTVAYQDVRAGENTALSASKFKSYDQGGAGLIPTASAEELKLNRFFINYSGVNLPSPDADPSFTAGNDYTTQRYIETQLNSGSYYDTGGSESIDEFHNRGSYYYFNWPRDGSDRSTRVNVHQQFISGGIGVGADVTSMRCLLFDHSKQVARVKVEQGRVVDVQLEDA